MQRRAMKCRSEGDGTRTRNLRIDSPVDRSAKQVDTYTYSSTPECAAPGAARSARIAATGTDLAVVVDAWPQLPAWARDSIMGIVKGAGRDQ